ncbi:MAG: hypothetical protein U0531_21415 [Dehalococcoidia bacterium]
MRGVTDAFDATYELSYREGIPAVVNDQRATGSAPAGDPLYGPSAVLP